MIGKKDVEGFFGNKKIAVIGASRSNKKYGNMLYMELVKKGYEVFPVNPNASNAPKPALRNFGFTNM